MTLPAPNNATSIEPNLPDRLALLASGRSVGHGTLDELREKAGLTVGDIEEVFLALT